MCTCSGVPWHRPCRTWHILPVAQRRGAGDPADREGGRRGLETALKFKLVTFRGTSKFVKLGKNVQVKKSIWLYVYLSMQAGEGSNDEKSITEIYVAHIISVRGTIYRTYSGLLAVFHEFCEVEDGLGDLGDGVMGEGLSQVGHQILLVHRSVSESVCVCVKNVGRLSARVNYYEHGYIHITRSN